MKTDLASTFPPLAAHPPREEQPGMLQAVQPVLPTTPASPSVAEEVVAAAPMQDFDLARDLTLFARMLRQAEGGRRVMAIFAISIAVTVASMFGQVRLNEWNGQFFDAVGRKDLSGFVQHIWTFLFIIAVLLALTVAQTFLQESLKFRLREWIARHLLVELAFALGALHALTLEHGKAALAAYFLGQDAKFRHRTARDVGCRLPSRLRQAMSPIGNKLETYSH